jgi:hypothetical protein
METDEASKRKGPSQALTQPIAPTPLNRILPVAIGHSLLRGGSDGFVPVMVAPTLIASAVLLALD